MDGVLVEDTICAVATPSGEGGIGVIRLSGTTAIAIAEKIVRLRSKHSLAGVPSHTFHLADIVDPSAPSQPCATALGIRLIDEGLVVHMKAPRSFTAEDVVEIHCHGSRVVLKQICEACVAAGARLAQPGEFTKRAFLNGRLDLSQAEAVLDTIKAKSELGLRQAQRQLRGELSHRVGQLRDRLIGLLANIEAGIDFSDEDLTFIQRDELLLALRETSTEVQDLLMTAETGRVLRDGAQVVIVGKPNTGKSSLLNALLHEDRAIVTDIAGTTRDVIEGNVVWDGVPITLIDTAGVRATTDVIEQEGIRRSQSAREQGDLILHVLDASVLETQGFDATEVQSTHPEDVVILNKIDLVEDQKISSLSSLVQEHSPCRVLFLSVRTGSGLDELRHTIVSQLSGESLEADAGLIVTNVRHHVALERAKTAMNEAITSIQKGMEPEFIAMDLRGATDALGEITGVVTSDDILNRIFSEFCIGK